MHRVHIEWFPKGLLRLMNAIRNLSIRVISGYRLADEYAEERIEKEIMIHVMINPHIAARIQILYSQMHEH